MLPSKQPDADDGLDVEQQPVRTDSNASKNTTRKRNVLISSAVLVCIVVLVGVLAARPWQAGNQPQQPQTTSSSQSTLAVPWPHAASDIQPDPRVTYGTLSNGLRYMVMENSEPRNQVMLRMHVDAGSYQEEDDQQGLAHFLEHMAFNGLRSFDAEELIPEMQRLGIAFGAHANAATSFDETYYELNLPNSTDEKALDISFAVMRDFADGMLLEEEEIEKERGVILSEMTFRDSVSLRLLKKSWNKLFPEHRLPARFPVGDAGVISTVPRQRFVDFYENYYTPSRITVIVCGDADPKEMEKRIIETYEGMQAKRQGHLGNDIDLLGKVTTGTGFEAAVFTDPELVNEQVTLTFSRPYEMPDDTESSRIARFPLAFAHNILSRRLDIASKKEGSPFRSGSASESGREGILGRSGIEMGSISVTLASTSDTNWKDTIPILEQEFRRALLFGFAQHELAEVKSNYMTYYQTKVDVATTRQSQSLAADLRNTIKDRSVFTTPTEDLRIFTKAIETIELGDIHEAFKSFWDTSDLKLILNAKDAEPDTPDVMEKIFAQSMEINVEAPMMELDTTFMYSEFGEPGKIVSDSTQKDLDIRQLKLSNNIRVNLKKTDFQASSIGIIAQFGTGVVSQDESKPGIQYLAGEVMNKGGLGKHSSDDIKRILAGKNVGVEFSVNEGSFALSGATTPEDLKVQMQLMAATINDPGFRPEALQYWKQSAPSYDTMFKSQLGGAQFFVEEYLKGDMRFAVPSLDEMNALATADVRDWLDPQLANSYLELSIVGAFDMENTISIVLETFGALSNREESPSVAGDEWRDLAFPDTPGDRTFTYESKLPSASSIVVWNIPHLREDIAAMRQLSVLSSILKDRLRKHIREDIGESYSPVAYTSISEDFNYGILRAESPGTADAVEYVGRQILAIAKNMTASMDEDELMRAREPIMTSIETKLRSNNYWLNVMSRSQARPWKLDWARSLQDDFESITLADLVPLAEAYLQPENAIRMEIIPINTGVGSSD